MKKTYFNAEIEVIYLIEEDCIRTSLNDQVESVKDFPEVSPWG